MGSNPTAGIAFVTLMFLDKIKLLVGNEVVSEQVHNLSSAKDKLCFLNN